MKSSKNGGKVHEKEICPSDNLLLDNDKFRLFKGGADSHKLQEAIRLFKSVDSDRNGTLDLEEYKKLCEQVRDITYIGSLLFG